MAELDINKIEMLVNDMMIEDVEDRNKEKFNYLKETVPTIYDKILSGDTGPEFTTILKFMFEKLRSSGPREKETEIVGEYLAERYIYPVVKKAED